MVRPSSRVVGPGSSGDSVAGAGKRSLVEAIEATSESLASSFDVIKSVPALWSPFPGDTAALALVASSSMVALASVEFARRSEAYFEGRRRCNGEVQV